MEARNFDYDGNLVLSDDYDEDTRCLRRLLLYKQKDGHVRIDVLYAIDNKDKEVVSTDGSIDDFRKLYNELPVRSKTKFEADTLKLISDAIGRKTVGAKYIVECVYDIFKVSNYYSKDGIIIKDTDNAYRLLKTVADLFEKGYFEYANEED